jgi:hypothetical protein
MARSSHLALATLAVTALALVLGAAPANAQDEVGLPQTYTLPPLHPPTPARPASALQEIRRRPGQRARGLQ